MNKEITQFIEDNKVYLSRNGINVDKIKNTELDFIEDAEQVDLLNNKYLARITYFDSQRLYIQIIDIETEKTIYFFDDVYKDNTTLYEFLKQAIEKMIF